METFAKRTQNIEEYYFSKKLDQVRKLDTSDFPVINFGIGSPDLPPPEAVVEALCKSAANPLNHGYQPYKGTAGLREAIASFYHRWYHVQLSPESEILPLMGSKEGIMHISQCFVNEGEIVLVPDPGYPAYASAAALLGAEVRTYRISEATSWKLDLEDFRRLPLERVKLVWVNFPHMPTGAATDYDGLKALMQLAREFNFLVVNDNPYNFILNTEPFSIFSVEGAHGQSLELGSLSKSHNLAGWRIGWVAGDQALVGAVLKVRSLQDSGMFKAIQEGAMVALNQPKEWFDGLNQVYKDRKNYFLKLLGVLGCSVRPNQKGMFLWAQVPDTIENVEEWLDELLFTSHIFITPGFIFGREGARFIRISLCTPKERILEAMDRLVKKNSTPVEVKEVLL
jgi:aspartate/methionine/tyrosine aminotransferase